MAKKRNTPKKEIAKDNDIEPPEEEDSGIEIKKAAPTTEYDLALGMLKRIKAELKDGEELIGKYFEKLEITFGPLKFNAYEKPRATTL